MILPILSLLNVYRFALSGDANCDSSNTCATGLPVVGASSDELSQILKIVFGIMSAVAVLMIVIAGFRFVVAQGNPQDVAKARQTIIYSVIGLAVALTAEAIVAFVLGKL
jgi:hypothetical protein